jgi:hypothetical protein
MRNIGYQRNHRRQMTRPETPEMKIGNSVTLLFKPRRNSARQP